MILRTSLSLVAVILLLLFVAPVLIAEPALLGADPPDALETLGNPAQVYVAESDQVELETVVFFYADFQYLYFHDNRVWQVRYDERSEHRVMGLEMGADRSEVIAKLGPPVAREGDSATFELEDRGFPVRMRAFFEDESLVDLYVYRSDY